MSFQSVEPYLQVGDSVSYRSADGAELRGKIADITGNGYAELHVAPMGAVTIAPVNRLVKIDAGCYCGLC